MANVTNKAAGPRGVILQDGRSALLLPGCTEDLQLSDHPVHDAWVACGELEVEASAVEPEPELFGPPPPPAIQEPPNERKQRGRRNAS